MFSSFQVNVPQLDADVDRVKAQPAGVPLTDVFETLQIYLGSLYVNDFNRFGRTYQVRRAGGRAVPRARRTTSRSSRRATPTGEMVPLGALLDGARKRRPGPRDALQRLSSPPTSTAGRRRASAPARRRRRSSTSPPRRCRTGIDVRVDRADLPADPRGQRGAAASSRCASCSCSWCSPRSTRACAAARDHPDRADGAARRASPGVWLTGGDNNIFTQIGLFVLVGLAARTRS